jgi:hypothetical protein
VDSADYHTIHLLLTHVNEENITQTPTGQWECWGHRFPQKTNDLLDQLTADSLVAINEQGTAFLTHPRGGLDILIDLNEKIGIPQ